MYFHEGTNGDSMQNQVDRSLITVPPSPTLLKIRSDFKLKASYKGMISFQKLKIEEFRNK
jgi:hypothetical protein